MRNVIRLGALLALALGGLEISAVAADAKSVVCDEAGTCKVYCTQSLPNGNYVEYDEGTTITVTSSDGKTYKYKCQNGQWVQQSALLGSPALLGNLGPTTIGPIKTTDALSLTIDGLYRLRSRMPDRSTCNPTDVTCF